MDIETRLEEEELRQHSPLALRLRPRDLEMFVGQEHLIGEGKPLRCLIESDRLSSLLFYGPPGTGKTALAEIIAFRTKADFIRVNATSSSVAELRKVMDKARNRLAGAGVRTILFIDEIHRFNKAQQDTLLPAVEKGIVVLIGATTENPYFTVNAPLLSRMRVFPFQPLAEKDIRLLLERALASDFESGLKALVLTDDAILHLVQMSNGDARAALNALELSAVMASAGAAEERVVNRKIAEEAVLRRAVVYDRDGDNHYDVISAFIKSIRGSDPDAALFWLARMLEAGEDPLFIARRLVISASEDIGNADPHALQLAVAASQALQMIGLPEGRITLAQATCYLATAPKSNAAYLAVNEAMDAVKKSPAAMVPAHLRGLAFPGAGKAGHGTGYTGYQYPHDFPGNYVTQNYLPEGMPRPTFYRPGNNGYERTIAERMARWAALRKGKG
jgi:putative ATPase